MIPSPYQHKLKAKPCNRCKNKILRKWCDTCWKRYYTRVARFYRMRKRWRTEGPTYKMSNGWVAPFDLRRLDRI